jgi:hypothetical protein
VNDVNPYVKNTCHRSPETNEDNNFETHSNMKMPDRPKSKGVTFGPTPIGEAEFDMKKVDFMVLSSDREQLSKAGDDFDV